MAGFSIINIGIESVNRNSLLETAKVQNTATELQNAVSTIHSYGFVIIPGFIFGFDSDDKEVFNDTLKFKIDTGLIGGEPAFLQALAGGCRFSCRGFYRLYPDLYQCGFSTRTFQTPHGDFSDLWQLRRAAR